MINLAAGESFSFTVKAKEDLGQGKYVSIVTVSNEQVSRTVTIDLLLYVDAPGEPLALEVTPGNGQLLLTWAAPLFVILNKWSVPIHCKKLQ